MESELTRVAKLTNRETWAVWKFQIRVILNSHGTLEVALGESVKPIPAAAADDAARAAHTKELASWKKLDATAQKVIVRTIGPQPTMHIINCTSAADMWQKLSSIYEQKSETSVHILQQDWYNATKKKSDDISTHIAKLEDIAHRLKLMGEEISDSMMITKILMTLPEYFRHFVSAWESAPAGERTLDNLKARLVTEEFRITIREVKSGNALASNTQRVKSKRGRGGTSRGASNGSSKPGKCYVCGEAGHWARDC